MTEKAVVRQIVRGVAERALAEHQARVDVEQSVYRMDPFAFIRRLLVWDPINLGFVPFEPWPHQVELVSAWMDLDGLAETGRLRFRNVLGDKSRQMGDTVIMAAACLWVVTHHDAPLLMQHQDLQEVSDSGPTWDSFFGKIKAMWGTQPWDIGKAPLRFIGGNNPIIRNASHPIRFITGEGQTPDPGRGGRYAGAFIDEAARLRFDQQAQAALQRACPDGRMMLSTPKGRSNVFFRIHQARPAGWTIVDHHWSKHPIYRQGIHRAAVPPNPRTKEPGSWMEQDKDMLDVSLKCKQCAGTVMGAKWTSDNPDAAHRYPGKLTSPWYEHAIVELTDEQVAEELDIDYTASLTARVYEPFSEAEHVLADIPYDPAFEIELSFDYGWDVTAVGIWQDAPWELRKIGEVEFTETLPADVADGVRAVLVKLGVERAALQKVLTRQLLAVGDPAGEGTSLSSGEPLTADYLRAGFAITHPGQQRVATTVKALTRLLLGRPKPIRYSRRGCPLTILHMQENRWPTDAQGNRRPGATKPVDDEHNHMCRADAYYATFKFPPPPETEFAPPEDDLDRYAAGGSPYAQAFAVSSGFSDDPITPGMGL